MMALGTSHHTTLAHVIELIALVATKNHVKITRQRDGKFGKYVGGRSLKAGGRFEGDRSSGILTILHKLQKCWVRLVAQICTTYIIIALK